MAVSQSADEPVVIYNIDAKIKHRSIPGEDEKHYAEVEWSEDGIYLAYFNRTDKKLVVWNYKYKEVVKEIKNVDGEYLRWDKYQNELLYVNRNTSSIEKVKLNQNVTEYVSTEHNPRIYSIDWSIDGTLLAHTGDYGGNPEIWIPHRNKMIKEFEQVKTRMLDVKWSPDGSKLAFCGFAGKIMIFNTADKSIYKDLKITENVFSTLEWSPDSKNIIAGATGGSIYLYNLNAGKYFNININNESVIDIDWHPSGDIITISCEKNGNFNIFNYSYKNGVLKNLTGSVSSKKINDIEWSKDGTMLAVAKDEKSLRIYDDQLNMMKNLHPEVDLVKSISWSPNDEMILCNGNDFETSVIAVNSGKLFRSFTGHKSAVREVSWSGDGNSITSVSEKGSLIYWDIFDRLKQVSISDSLWSIVVPEVVGNDIDLGYEFVGEVKDTTLVDYFKNIGNYDVTINEILIGSQNEKDFDVLSTKNSLFIPKKSGKDLILKFRPNSIGQRTSKLIVRYNADTLRYDMRGCGVEKKIKAAHKIIDFGKLERGNLKDTSLYRILESLSELPLEDVRFEFVSNENSEFGFKPGFEEIPEVFAPKEKIDLELRFEAKKIGPARGKLLVYYQDVPLPVEIVLIGEVTEPDISIRLLIRNFEVETGKKIKMPIIMLGEDSKKLAPGDSLYFDLVISSDILAATEEPFGHNEAGKRVIPIKAAAQRDADMVFYTKEFEAVLSSDSTAEISIMNITSSGGFIEVIPLSGMCKVKDICREGGARLLRIDGEDAGIQSIDPNPATGLIKVKLNLVEKGSKKLILRSYVGQKLLEMDLPEMQTGNYEKSVDISGYSRGIYFFELVTPGSRENRKLIIK